MPAIEAILNGTREEIVPGMTFPTYREALGLNASVIKRGEKSMKHLLDAWNGEVKDTDAMLLGRGYHCLLLEASEFERRFWPFEGRRAGQMWEAFKAECKDAGAEPMKQEQFDSVIEAATAWLADPLVVKEVAGAKAEVSMFTVENGLQCKCRLDAIRGDTLIDVKTTSAITHREFGRQFASLGYHVQLGLYEHWARRLLKSANPLRVVVICVENTRPYDTVVRYVDPEIINTGREKGLRIIERVRECLESGVWHGVAEGTIHGVEFPEWAMEEDMDIYDGRAT